MEGKPPKDIGDRRVGLPGPPGFYDRMPDGSQRGSRGGTEFGPGRGSRIPEGPQKGMPMGNDQLPKGFKGTGFLQDFLARIAQLKGGGIR